MTSMFNVADGVNVIVGVFVNVDVAFGGGVYGGVNVQVGDGPAVLAG